MDDTNAKVLIVEDDLSSQQYYTIIFSGHYEITMAADVAEAKEFLKNEEFQVAIVDISLPGDENGLDLIKYLCEEYPDKPVPIALTGHAFPKNREDALAAGAVEFFTKPIMSRLLLDTVAKYITE